MLKIVEDFFEHTFNIDSNIKGVKVTYIVDPYDRTKDIVCFTPSKISIPWRPLSKKCSLNRVIFEKAGYQAKVVELKPSKKMFLKFTILGMLLGLLGGFLHFELGISSYFVLFIYLLMLCNLSFGSKDLFVVLDKEQ